MTKGSQNQKIALNTLSNKDKLKNSKTKNLPIF